MSDTRTSHDAPPEPPVQTAPTVSTGPSTRAPRLLCFATQGYEHIEGERIRNLLAPLHPEVFAFDHDHKLRSAVGLTRTVLASRPDLVVMEGTGMAGGVTLLLLNALLGTRYVVSSGDAVGPFLRLRSRLIGALGGAYERLLCRRSAGFVGWTPYLVGRALTFGAPVGMTAPGWTRDHAPAGAREQVRRRLGISEETLVVGLVGSLHWNERVGYAYGAELVQAIRRVARRDLMICIVGDGSGRPRLEAMAGEDLGARVLFTGRVPPTAVPEYLAAFDAATLSQSVDAVGSFRYSTKLSEYRAAELPIIIGEIPAAYDLDEGYFWRLPGSAPWSETHIEALARLLERLSAAEVADKRAAIARLQSNPFDPLLQQRRMKAFVTDILADRH